MRMALDDVTKFTCARFRREEFGSRSGRVSFRVSSRWQKTKTEANRREDNCGKDSLPPSQSSKQYQGSDVGPLVDDLSTGSRREEPARPHAQHRGHAFAD